MDFSMELGLKGQREILRRVELESRKSKYWLKINFLPIVSSATVLFQNEKEDSLKEG